ncbi:MAG: prolipoprotein diacylglyceryl transferase family protein [Rubritalea sp.]|uniref:prolipoprotein diacylglyceryl transferase n=1 Tax=Rubritalea sp. TaxID=2109375 RepID=UPI00324210DB
MSTANTIQSAVIGMPMYGLMVMLAVGVSLVYWLRAAKSDQRLLLIYFSAIAGAFVGAKLAYFIAEAWIHTGPDAWRQWLVGKSITGALLGGFLGVELGKKLVGYSKSTGDRFALIIPWGVMMGRVGCLRHGCCTGKLFESGYRWPSVEVELGANVLIWCALMLVRKKAFAQNQLFHIYLVVYGVFRYVHEFLRATPKLAFGISGYQWIALAIISTGLIAFKQRSRKRF